LDDLASVLLKKIIYKNTNYIGRIMGADEEYVPRTKLTPEEKDAREKQKKKEYYQEHKEEVKARTKAKEYLENKD